MIKQLADKNKVFEGEIEINENAKKIYRKILGRKFSNSFYVSKRQLLHIITKHTEINVLDIFYCINNPNFVTVIKDKHQINIISYLGNSKYIYILVDVKLNYNFEIKFNKNGILSARYLSNKKFNEEIRKNKIIYVNIENINQHSV